MLGDIVKKAGGSPPPKAPRRSSRLADSLRKAMGMGEDGPPPKAGMNFRCSGLPYLCPRLYAMAIKGMVKLNEAPDARLSWTFGTGTAFHTQFQEDYLQRLPKDIFQGWWRNRSTGEVIKGPRLLGSNTLSHKWCAKPDDGQDYEYIELEFYSKAHRLSGHCDGVLVWPDTDPEVFELKTISARQWTKVDPDFGGEPKLEHVLQVQAYMWLTGLKKSRVMYVKKDLSQSVDSVLCEHVVEYSQEIVDRIQATLGACCLAVDAPIETDLPERLPECRSKSRSRMYCDGKDACFAD